MARKEPTAPVPRADVTEESRRNTRRYVALAPDNSCVVAEGSTWEEAREKAIARGSFGGSVIPVGSDGHALLEVPHLRCRRPRLSIHPSNAHEDPFAPLGFCFRLFGERQCRRLLNGLIDPVGEFLRIVSCVARWAPRLGRIIGRIENADARERMTLRANVLLWNDAGFWWFSPSSIACSPDDRTGQPADLSDPQCFGGFARWYLEFCLWIETRYGAGLKARVEQLVDRGEGPRSPVDVFRELVVRDPEAGAALDASKAAARKWLRDSLERWRDENEGQIAHNRMMQSDAEAILMEKQKSSKRDEDDDYEFGVAYEELRERTGPGRRWEEPSPKAGQPRRVEEVVQRSHLEWRFEELMREGAPPRGRPRSPSDVDSLDPPRVEVGRKPPPSPSSGLETEEEIEKLRARYPDFVSALQSILDEGGKVTQQEVAKRLGVSQPTVSRLFRTIRSEGTPP